MIACENIQIAPFELIRLVDLKIVKRINEHTLVTFSGVVPEAEKDSYIEAAKAQTKVEINLTLGAANTPLFKGLVTRIQVKNVRDVYHLEVEAVSHTYALDIQVKNRSFQDQAMAYTDLVKQVIKDYQGTDVKDSVSKGAKLEQLTVQYAETDWQFLKRMASRFQAGLFAADTFEKPKFFFGIPEGESQAELVNFHYTVRKELARFRNVAQNHQPQAQEDDFVYYDVETDRVLNLGDQVKYQKQSLYVYRMVAQLEESFLKFNYLLAPQGGLTQKTLYNQQLVGASLQGKVIEVVKDNVRVHLDIDPEQPKDKAYWFPYSSVYTAEGHSGWYCMPEIGDCVRVYLPDREEKNAVALSSVRQDSAQGQNNKVSDPDVKYFRTKSGKELMLAPGEIVLSGKDGEVFIRLNDGDGIEIHGKAKVKIYSKEDVTIESEKQVNIGAAELLSIKCKDSDIKLDGTTNLKGYEIKSN